jgi:hypothetical protein
MIFIWGLGGISGEAFFLGASACSGFVMKLNFVYNLAF